MRHWTQLLSDPWKQDWVVYAKPPFAGPEQVLKYLSRYTHRVAISNQRIVSIDIGVVRFEYRDYADCNQSKEVVLAASELLRRFLQHVDPKGFMRIRHDGITANRRRKEQLARCRELLGQSLPVADTGERKATGVAADARDGGAIRCPARGGAVRFIEIVTPSRCISYDTS